MLDREHEIAKAHLATGQKDRAVIALRRRKYQQSLLLKTDSQLESLEQLVRVSFMHLRESAHFPYVRGIIIGVDYRVLFGPGFCPAWPQARQ